MSDLHFATPTREFNGISVDGSQNPCEEKLDTDDSQAVEIEAAQKLSGGKSAHLPATVWLQFGDCACFARVFLPLDVAKTVFPTSRSTCFFKMDIALSLWPNSRRIRAKNIWIGLVNPASFVCCSHWSR